LHVLWRHAFVNGVPLTDSDFNRYHAFDPSRQPSFCQDSTRLSVPFLASVDDRATLVSRYVPLTWRDNTPDTFALTKGTREMGCSWAIGELLPPDRRTRLARRWFALFKATADTRYKYFGSGTNWRNARLCPFSTYVPRLRRRPGRRQLSQRTFPQTTMLSQTSPAICPSKLAQQRYQLRISLSPCPIGHA